MAHGWWLLLGLPLLGMGVWQGRRLLARHRYREFAAMMLRVFTVGTLVIALAGPLRQSASNRLDVIFALDISRSVDRETVARALGFFNQAMERKPPDAYVGLVAFGADAGVEAVLREFAEPIQELSVDVRRGYTDIGRALEVAWGPSPRGAPSNRVAQRWSGECWRSANRRGCRPGHRG